MSEEGVRRWCRKCALGGAHDGAERVTDQCEGCEARPGGRQVRATYGLQGEGGQFRRWRLRWCAQCAQSVEGAVHLAKTNCEGCHKRSAPGLLTQRGEGAAPVRSLAIPGDPYPLPIAVHAIPWKLPTDGPLADRELSPQERTLWFPAGRFASHRAQALVRSPPPLGARVRQGRTEPCGRVLKRLD